MSQFRHLPPYRGSSTNTVATAYFHHPAQYAFPYSIYGYNGGSSQGNMYPMNYYNVGGQQHQFSPYNAAGRGVFHNLYPYYAQTNQVQGGFGLHYPQMLQYPYMPQQSGAGILATAGVTAAASVGFSSSQQPGTTQEQRSSA